jgi:hypothetical protein
MPSLLPRASATCCETEEKISGNLVVCLVVLPLPTTTRSPDLPELASGPDCESEFSPSRERTEMKRT